MLPNENLKSPFSNDITFKIVLKGKCAIFAGSQVCGCERICDFITMNSKQ